MLHSLEAYKIEHDN